MPEKAVTNRKLPWIYRSPITSARLILNQETQGTTLPAQGRVRRSYRSLCPSTNHTVAMSAVTLHPLVAAACSPNNGNQSEEEYFSQFIIPYDGFLFPFEKNPKEKFTHFTTWWRKTRHYWLYITVAYLLAVFILRKFYMKHRKPFRLQTSVFLWNMALATFNMLCSWRALMDFFLIIKNYGFHSSVCTRLRYEFIEVWNLLFIFSKFVEFGDTFFIVLRKRRLLIRHYFHHGAVAFFAACFLQQDFTMGRLVMAINTIVCSCVYLYFALRVLDVPIPSWVKKVIASIQVGQYLIYLLLGLPYIWYTKMMKIPCLMPTGTSIVALMIITPMAYFIMKYNYDKYYIVWHENKVL